ncbi:MAG: putative aspartoacylase [Parcubacteria group bacterium GW2011_GWA1_36_12]|nr:MAG: putative aspartoacylase [Parcubacteria group bacterium GW2011_GWA1_36_12]
MSNIKVIEKIGKFKGPIVVVLAGVHGNEKAGVIAVENIYNKLKIKRGRVIFIIANLKALNENKRFIEKDLNRCFLEEQPLEIKNSLEGQTAREIMLLLKKADFMIDLHQSNSEKSKPFIICEEKTLDLTKFIPITTVTLGWSISFPGASASFVDAKGGNGIAVELGSVKDDNCNILAEKAIVNFLSGLKLISGSVEIFQEKEFLKIKKIHKNTIASFEKLRDFDDFEKLSGDCVIGNEGKETIRGEGGDFIIFVRDRVNLNMECFITLTRLS